MHTLPKYVFILLNNRKLHVYIYIYKYTHVNNITHVFYAVRDIYQKPHPHPVSHPWTRALQLRLVLYFGSQHEENELSLVTWQVTGYMDRVVHQDEAINIYETIVIAKTNGTGDFSTCLCKFHDIMGSGEWDHMKQQPSNIIVNFSHFFWEDYPH